MKKIATVLLFFFATNLLAQKQTFDLATYTVPKGWSKKATAQTVQFIKENPKTGAFCLITLYKSMDATNTPKENFDAAWSTLVKEAVTVSTEPEMQPAVTEKGWEVQSGYAPFESEDNKGIALLVSSSGYDKLVNILIMTNTDAYEAEMTKFLESVDLKKPVAAKKPVIKTLEEPVKPQAVVTGQFAFHTTNFDDGWTAVEQPDWVEVTKGNIKVLLHYPKEGTIFPADPEPLTNAAWNILVSPRYSNLRNYKTAYITTYNRPYLGMGYLTENSSGKDVFVLLFRQGETGWIEFIAPDKNSFIQQFKLDPETVQWDTDSDLMNPLSFMKTYNKFAVAASDFKGKWTSDFTGIQQLYHVYTGNYAGMNVNQSNEEFVFGAGSTYNWKLLVVNGMVGNMKFNQVKSAGKFSVPNNWQVHFSDIEGKPQKYHAFFSCIKGARILNLLNAEYPGSGIYTKYGLAK
jgi:hypothetical protein